MKEKKMDKISIDEINEITNLNDLREIRREVEEGLREIRNGQRPHLERENLDERLKTVQKRISYLLKMGVL